MPSQPVLAFHSGIQQCVASEASGLTVTVARDGGSRPDPAAFAAAADQAAWRRFASVISAHLADRIISVVTITAPGRYAAVAVAQAVVSDALNRQVLSSSHSADDRAQHCIEPAA